MSVMFFFFKQKTAYEVRISDWSSDVCSSDLYVEHIIQGVNALQPDLIAITGDVVDGPVDRLAPHTEPLGQLVARHGTYLVTGNHEYYSGAERWVAEFRRLGLHVLMNQHAVVRHGDASLVVAGVTDRSEEHTSEL